MIPQWLPLVLLALAVPATADEPSELLPPVQIQVAGQPLDVQRDGLAAPFVGDVDGDGLRDLLVGQYHGGRLRVYRNSGSDAQPKFDTYTWFHAAGAPGRVPEG